MVSRANWEGSEISATHQTTRVSELLDKIAICSCPIQSEVIVTESGGLASPGIAPEGDCIRQ